MLKFIFKNWGKILIGIVTFVGLLFVVSLLLFLFGLSPKTNERKLDWSFLQTNLKNVRSIEDPPIRILIPADYKQRVFKTRYPLLLLKNMPLSTYHPISWRLRSLRDTCQGCVMREKVSSNLRAVFIPVGSEYSVVDAYSYMGKEGELKFYILSDEKKNLTQVFEVVFQMTFLNERRIELVDKRLLKSIQEINLGIPVKESICSKREMDLFNQFQTDLKLLEGIVVNRENDCEVVTFTSVDSFLTYKYFKGEWGML